MTPYDLAFEYALHTCEPIFLTGKAGTGKTTFLRKLRSQCSKQIMVVAPTGVAAINAEGVTIHSLFQLPPQLFLPTPLAYRTLFSEMQMRGAKRKLLRNLELLVIDEVSMVRADLLDAIDAVLRHFKHRYDDPFGGVQVLFIGDLYQLSPVAREEDWAILREYYEGPYFFQARVFQNIHPIYIELDHVYRQTNLDFINLLNEVRSNTLSPASLALLNTRYQPTWEPDPNGPFYIVLSTHNRKVDAINEREMAKLTAKEYDFSAEIEGTFPASMYPVEEKLVLREGARVMFIKSDSSPEKRYYNGKLGIIYQLRNDSILVECETEDGKSEFINVHREEWENTQYVSKPGSDEIESKVVGTFSQYPLRPAWAVTIHKAQGLTFDRVVIDAADAFASGQVYVALSRCRTLEGIILLSPIPNTALTNAREVISFTSSQPSLQTVEQRLTSSEDSYFLTILRNLYDFRASLAQLEYLKHVVSSATSFNQSDFDEYYNRLSLAFTDIQKTAETFQTQLRHILTAEKVDYTFLFSRLKSAATYFAEKISLLLSILQASPVYTDDKSDAKSYREAVTELLIDLSRQAYLMGKMAVKPSIRNYFSARKLFAIPKFKLSISGEEKTEKVTRRQSEHPELLKALSALRREIAEQEGATDHIYSICPTATLIEIADKLPVTKKELMAIKGFGAKRFALFGPAVIDLVLEYKRIFL